MHTILGEEERGGEGEEGRKEGGRESGKGGREEGRKGGEERKVKMKEEEKERKGKRGRGRGRMEGEKERVEREKKVCLVKGSSITDTVSGQPFRWCSVCATVCGELSQSESEIKGLKNTALPTSEQTTPGSQSSSL